MGSMPAAAGRLQQPRVWQTAGFQAVMPMSSAMENLHRRLIIQTCLQQHLRPLKSQIRLAEHGPSTTRQGMHKPAQAQSPMVALMLTHKKHWQLRPMCGLPLLCCGIWTSCAVGVLAARRAIASSTLLVVNNSGRALFLLQRGHDMVDAALHKRAGVAPTSELLQIALTRITSLKA